MRSQDRPTRPGLKGAVVHAALQLLEAYESLSCTEDSHRAYLRLIEATRALKEYDQERGPPMSQAKKPGVKKRRDPDRLQLLPGLRWRGELRILKKLDTGEYVVAFNAEDPRADPQERWVLDNAVLTAKQLKDWTGWEEPCR